MCRDDVGDNLYADSIVTIARKMHECNECTRTIHPGEPFRKDFVVWDRGSAGSFLTCEHCSVLLEWLGVNCDGWIFGEVVDDIHEHSKDYKRLDLARLVVGARRGWEKFNPRGFAGMAVPKMPRKVP